MAFHNVCTSVPRQGSPDCSKAGPDPLRGIQKEFSSCLSLSCCDCHCSASVKHQNDPRPKQHRLERRAQHVASSQEPHFGMRMSWRCQGHFASQRKKRRAVPQGKEAPHLCPQGHEQKGLSPMLIFSQMVLRRPETLGSPWDLLASDGVWLWLLPYRDRSSPFAFSDSAFPVPSPSAGLRWLDGGSKGWHFGVSLHGHC